MKFRQLLVGTLLVLSGMCLPAKATPILNLDTNNQLTGAHNIEIAGSLYNVKFVEGTCFQTFSGCNEGSDFFWRDYDSAQKASLALLGQIFTPENALFDDIPWMTAGCEDDGFNFCELVTPYEIDGVFFNSRGAANYDSSEIDRLMGLSMPADAPMEVFTMSTFAVWSNTTPVTEPHSLALILFGALCILTRKRKR